MCAQPFDWLTFFEVAPSIHPSVFERTTREGGSNEKAGREGRSSIVRDLAKHPMAVVAGLTRQTYHRTRSRRRNTALEHAFFVCCSVRDDLQHIPVFHDFTGAVEAEDVDACIVMVAGPVLVAV